MPRSTSSALIIAACTISDGYTVGAISYCVNHGETSSFVDICTYKPSNNTLVDEAFKVIVY